MLRMEPPLWVLRRATPLPARHPWPSRLDAPGVRSRTAERNTRRRNDRRERGIHKIRRAADQARDMAFSSPEQLRAPRPGRVRRVRLERGDGSRTTVHVASHDTERTEVRVAVLRGQARLEPWCAARGVEEAIVGGFFVRPDGTPLGEVRTRGVARRHVPFAAPYAKVRACVHVRGGTTAIAPRDELPEAPAGDLLQ